jgi:lipopolysaccharide export LptBFGC system permease protein LptF
MMVVSLVVGLGPLMFRRATVFLVAGALLELIFWITGQALGELMTGGGTDPSAGPMVVLFALSLLPTAVSVANHPAVPLRSWTKSHSTAGFSVR